MTVVDRATKQVTLVPMYENVTAAKTANLFLQWVVRCHRMPQEVIACQNPWLMSIFLQQLLTKLGTTLLYNTAHHP